MEKNFERGFGVLRSPFAYFESMEFIQKNKYLIASRIDKGILIWDMKKMKCIVRRKIDDISLSLIGYHKNTYYFYD